MISQLPRTRGLSLCLLGLLSSIAAAVPTNSLPVGAGLEGIHDWSRSHAFADVVKQSRGFVQPDNTGAPAQIDSDGWPLEDFASMLLIDHSGLEGQEGVYKLSCVCAAVPTISFIGSPASASNIQRNPDTGEVTADITLAASGIQMFIVLRNTNGGVRNLRVLRPGYGPADAFTTPFLDHVARFSVLRFMDWTRANNSVVERWSDRAEPTDAQFTSDRGVPWEACIALANRAHKAMWVNVPHKADDDYVRQFARLLRDTLDPALPVYVEYSNEVWNLGFTQSAWNAAQAQAEVAAGNSPINYDGNGAQWAWPVRRVANRLRQITEIFEEEYGQGAVVTRVRPVLAGQGANPETIRQGLKMIDAVFGRPSHWFHAIALAPYFSLGASPNEPGMTVDQVLDALTASMQGVPSRFMLEEHAVMARFYNLKGLSYEAGPETYTTANIAAVQQASHDPRIRTICRNYMRTWASYGFDTMTWYVGGATDWATQWGTFGLCEDMRDTAAPKLLAIDDILAEPRPALVAGFAVPSNIDARLCTPHYGNWAADPYLRWLHVGRTFDYLVRSSAGGPHRLRISAATTLPNAQLKVELNGAYVATPTVPPTGSYYTFGDSAPVTLDLPAGLSVIRLTVLTEQGYNINWIRVQTASGGPCAGDATGDGVVDFVDLNVVLSEFGQIGPALLGDVDADGDVDFADLILLLSRIGLPC